MGCAERLDEKRLAELGVALGSSHPPPGLIYLRGPLGVGKTTLCRSVLRGLGHMGKVKSPTYSLVETYPELPLQVVHIDLYRVVSSDELEHLGLRDLLDGRSLCMIEWPERARGRLAPADLEIDLAYVEGAPGRRQLRWKALSPDGERMAEAFQA